MVELGPTAELFAPPQRKRTPHYAPLRRLLAPPPARRLVLPFDDIERRPARRGGVAEHAGGGLG
jgi:hypothetical protein